MNRAKSAPCIHDSDSVLHENETFHTLFERSSEAMLLLSLETHTFIECNDAALRLMGFLDKKQLLDRSVHEISPARQPDGRSSEEVGREVLEHALKHRSARFEWSHQRANGEVFPVEVVLTLLELRQRPLMFITWREIAERRRMEESLRASEQKFRLLFERSNDPMLLLDARTMQFVDCNDAAVSMMRCASKEELLSLPPWEISPERQPDGQLSAHKAHTLLARVVATGSERFDWVHCRKDGSEFPVEVGLTSIELGDQPLTLAIWRDIADRLRAQESVRELNTQLEKRVVERTRELEAALQQLRRVESDLRQALAQEQELNRLKSNFVQVVSHEFRTPLGVILSSTDILEAYFDRLSPQDRLEHLAAIQHSTERMSGMMEEVLLLGLVESGQMKPNPQEVDLKVFTRAIVDELASATARRCPIEFACDLKKTRGRADEMLLRHVLTNLVSNAVKYSHAGRPVLVALARDGDRAVFTVQDEGIGIPEEDQARLFSAFYRAANVGSRRGTGIGLVLVRRCVELLGGDIRFKSKLGVGTTFTVSAPVFRNS